MEKKRSTAYTQHVKTTPQFNTDTDEDIGLVTLSFMSEDGYCISNPIHCLLYTIFWKSANSHDNMQRIVLLPHNILSLSEDTFISRKFITHIKLVKLQFIMIRSFNMYSQGSHSIEFHRKSGQNRIGWSRGIAYFLLYSIVLHFNGYNRKDRWLVVNQDSQEPERGTKSWNFLKILKFNFEHNFWKEVKMDCNSWCSAKLYCGRVGGRGLRSPTQSPSTIRIEHSLLEVATPGRPGYQPLMAHP